MKVAKQVRSVAQVSLGDPKILGVVVAYPLDEVLCSTSSLPTLDNALDFVLDVPVRQLYRRRGRRMSTKSIVTVVWLQQCGVTACWGTRGPEIVIRDCNGL